MSESKIKNIIICSCSERNLISEKYIKQLTTALKKSGIKYHLINDLCYWSAEKKTDLVSLFDNQKENIIIACYKRAVTALLNYAGVNKQIKIFDLRNNEPEEIASNLGIKFNVLDYETVEIPEYDIKEWNAWNPCIDYDRCVHCKKCVDFCMFNVYSINDNQKVEVTNPKNCKNNCPACARTCPKTAIIFPKYDKSPINGGLDSEDEKIGMDPKETFKDIKKELAERNIKKRKLFK